ncbi:MAG: hypothetical protein ACR2PR_10045, partial [Pseudohongiellaceae bacterium]
DSIGYANVNSGDEPHYMTIISSVINDGDLDIKNNYASTHSGGLDSGVRAQRTHLDHHTYFRLSEEGYTVWPSVIETNEQGRMLWWQNSDGYFFNYKPGYEHIADLPEYSWHPPFVAVIGYPLLWWFKNSPLLEPAALFLSYLVTLLAAVFAYWVLGSITQSVTVRFTALVIIFLATPVWHYSRTLFTEPFIAAFFICAYACFCRGTSIGSKHLAASLFIGLAMLMKPFAFIVMLPMFYSVLRNMDWRGFMALCVGPALGGCVVLYWYYLQSGSPFISPGAGHIALQADALFTLSAVLPTIYGMLFSMQYGLLPYCPALIPAAYGWWRLLQEHGRQAGVALLMALPYFALFTAYIGTLGGANYGPRYMMVLLPLLMVGIVGFLVYARLPRILHLGMWVLLVASFLINASAAVASWKFWYVHPVQVLLL